MKNKGLHPLQIAHIPGFLNWSKTLGLSSSSDKKFTQFLGGRDDLHFELAQDVNISYYSTTSIMADIAAS
ncbi:MAG: hypothetical protein V7K24_18200 [Nostoc sp.]